MRRFTKTMNKEEEIEGIDNSPDLEMHDYPLDSLLILDERRTAHDVCRRIKQGNYILGPDFQRDFVWELGKQSRLIESLLMRIPLPVFYLAERIDGLQRLTTISRYLNNEFALRKLGSENEHFLGKKFIDLSIKLQNRLEDTQLIMYILDEKVPERARMDIFERVNGGTPLSRQQMRNCMHCGAATRMLKELANNKHFLIAAGKSLNQKTMRDREFINRYMAFEVNGLDKYKGDMDDFLASALSEINKKSQLQIDALKEKFINAMDNCVAIWGRQVFRKPSAPEQTRNVINAALFDVLSVIIGNFQKPLDEKQKKTLYQKLLVLFSDDEFQNAITLSTNDLKRVRMRFKKVTESFQGV
jgi:hypothetical protein